MAYAESLSVGSDAFTDHCAIPSSYTADGEDLSPPLQWEHPPLGTKEFALIVDDPDAPSKSPWVHWVVYGIPGSMHDLPRGVTVGYAGLRQGKNSWRTLGYRGPNPPPGRMHHYRFTLYALDTALELSEGASAEELTNAMQGHILERRILTGTYGR
ncbi:MAG: YbhB/YbcL family Raf kinase inhibitor-like protein [Proteobacteria bacterium]|nr:YbhB/YbcL family Raf kinase inhibitor-like protein [Pseudomonadota bacterium]